MKKKILYCALSLLVVLFALPTMAQHTFGVYGGGGMANGRFEPTQDLLDNCQLNCVIPARSRA